MHPDEALADKLTEQTYPKYMEPSWRAVVENLLTSRSENWELTIYEKNLAEALST